MPTASADAAFARGVKTGRDSASGIAPLLFSARTLVLNGSLPAADSLEYLSGLLIGDELRCAVQGSAPHLALIGEPGLCERYRRALAVFGITDASLITGATEAGLWQIACHAGLVATSQETF
jgi:2-dehydro-3-deoxygalactonokinase